MLLFLLLTVIGQLLKLRVVFVNGSDRENSLFEMVLFQQNFNLMARICKVLGLLLLRFLKRPQPCSVHFENQNRLTIVLFAHIFLAAVGIYHINSS